jgi:hypothetical protein
MPSLFFVCPAEVATPVLQGGDVALIRSKAIGLARALLASAGSEVSGAQRKRTSSSLLLGDHWSSEETSCKTRKPEARKCERK